MPPDERHVISIGDHLKVRKFAEWWETASKVSEGRYWDAYRQGWDDRSAIELTPDRNDQLQAAMDLRWLLTHLDIVNNQELALVEQMRARLSKLVGEKL